MITNSLSSRKLKRPLHRSSFGADRAKKCWMKAKSPMMVLQFRISLAGRPKKADHGMKKQDPGYPEGKMLYM